MLSYANTPATQARKGFGSYDPKIAGGGCAAARAYERTGGEACNGAWAALSRIAAPWSSTSSDDLHKDTERAPASYTGNVNESTMQQTDP